MSQPAAHRRIGEVAERTGLSLRTIRYYGEMGLVEPSARSRGGFRLYTESDIERLLLVKRMKPLGFSVEDMRELLTLLDRLADAGATASERTVLLDSLAGFEEAVANRCAELREQLAIAEEFGDLLRARRGEHEGAEYSREKERR